VLLFVAFAAALGLGAAPAGATRECEGLMVCVAKAGPWVVVPTGGDVPRPRVEYQLACPRHYVVGGLDAEVSERALDVTFVGLLGSPVNPGVTTSTSVVFVASYVGRTAATASFRPHVGCLPGKGGGSRVPTAAGTLVVGHPTIRRVRTVRVRPGSGSVVQACRGRERLVDAAEAVGFFMRRPPDASLARSVTATLALTGNRAVARVRADAEISAVHAVVQVQAVCTSAS
jgi:hypothetical protein